MILSKKNNAIAILSLVVLCSTAHAQETYDDPNVGYKYNQKTIRNQYPCGECAVFDNNGNDLRGFINTTKRDLSAKADRVNEYSNNTWGYVAVKNVKIPSVNKSGDLDYTQSFDVTLGMYKTGDAEKATWWAREYNSAKGPVVHLKVDDKGKLPVDDVKHTEMLHEFESKKITLVERYGDNYNQEDYDMLFKNYLMMPAGIIKDVSGYKQVVDYYNNFLNRFSSVADPFYENKSFITCLSVNNVKYIGYFNIVNSKLAGKLELANIEYDRDRDTVINNTFKRLTGKVVFIYGDNIFGMDKKLINYGRKNDVKLVRRTTNDAKKFNEEK